MAEMPESEDKDRSLGARSSMIRLEGLDFGYNSDLIFREFEFEIGQPITIIEGHSGCGKTTLLKLLSGFLSPTRVGNLQIADRPLLVLQEDALLPWLTGWNNLALMLGRSTPDRNVESGFWNIVEPLLSKRAHALSYGQRRVIELARALLAPADALLFDEPFNYLDRERAKCAWQAMCKSANPDLPIVLTTHHHREFALKSGAAVFRFDGQPPWQRLRRVA